MPINKSAYIRFRIIDQCLRNKQKPYPSKEDLIEACTEVVGKVSMRTIEKDLEEMKNNEELGYLAPIVYERRYNGYCYSDQHYSINKMPLREEELYALDFAKQLMRQFDGLQPVQSFAGAVQKIEELINLHDYLGDEKLDDYVQVEKGWVQTGNEYLGILLQAIRERKVVTLMYQRFEPDAAKQHHLHPYLLKEYRNRWYVLGYHPDKKQITTFALDRIKSLELKDEKFSRESSFNTREYFAHAFGISVPNNLQPAKVTFTLPASEAMYVKSQPLHHSQRIVSETSKACKFEIEVIESYELVAQLLSFGSKIKVHSPAHLKNKIQQELEAALQNYIK